MMGAPRTTEGGGTLPSSPRAGSAQGRAAALTGSGPAACGVELGGLDVQRPHGDLP